MKGLKVLIKPKKNARRSPELRGCLERFDAWGYKARKNGERGAIIYDKTMMYFQHPQRQRTMVKLMAASHNTKRLIKLKIKYRQIMRQIMTIKTPL